MRRRPEYSVLYDGAIFVHRTNRYVNPNLDVISVEDMQRLRAEDQAYPNTTVAIAMHGVPQEWERIAREGFVPPRRICVPDTPISFRRLYVTDTGELLGYPSKRAIAVYNPDGKLVRYRLPEQRKWVRAKVEVRTPHRGPVSPPTPETDAPSMQLEKASPIEPPQEDPRFGAQPGVADSDHITPTSDFRQRWDEEWDEFMQSTSFQVRDVQADSEQLKRGQVARVTAEVERKSGIRLRSYQAQALADTISRKGGCSHGD